ncbi:hypothetical protein ES708_11433 [subsurface metagenome]
MKYWSLLLIIAAVMCLCLGIGLALVKLGELIF